MIGKINGVKMTGRTNSLLLAGGVLVPIGVVFLVIGALVTAAAWISAVGAALLGTGLTIITTTLTSEHAVQEQYRKEANIQRKREIYGPLHSELKQLHCAFEAAANGLQPLPQWIAVAGKQYPELVFDPLYAVVSLQSWPAFRADYRADNFQEHTRGLLDELHHRAEIYDDAMLRVEKILIAILIPHVISLVEDARTAEAQGRAMIDLEWVQNLNQNLTSTEIGTIWATAWITSWPIHQKPATLGWTLAGAPERAARTIHESLLPRNDAIPSIPRLNHLFQTALTELEYQREYHVVRQAKDSLLILLEEVENRLDTGLRYIRDHYEGGQPPV